MGRAVILSNGRLCVGLDEKGFVNDFYYPYVGMHNTASARFIHHKIGVWVDGSFSWLDSPEWNAHACLDDHAMIARVKYVNHELGISLSLRDFVDVSYDFFGRVVIIENRGDKARDVRLFFCQVFQISHNGRADTALYTPSAYPYILTYHGDTSVVTGLRTESGEGFDQFAVGNYGIEGKAGTYLDSVDGELSGNLVEHGGVDSVIRTSFTIQPKHAYHVDYWNAVSDRNYSHATHIHRHLSKNGLYHYLNATTLYWKKWLQTATPFLAQVNNAYAPMATRSLLIIKAHLDARGGIIASADSSIYNYGRDYYNYVWPRDAYYALQPLLRAGFIDEIKQYLDFVMRTIHQRGYVNHKYLPDYSLGSTWHPLMQNGEPELNIQEDETAATVLLASELLQKIGTDTAFSKKIWKKIIKPSARFMAEYISTDTGLPHPSYDLWEEVFVTSTYTTGIVYAALRTSIRYAGIFEPDLDIQFWQDAHDSIQKNIGQLFDEKNQWFVRGLVKTQDGYKKLSTLDISSLYSMVTYGPAKSTDTSVYATLQAVQKHLTNPTAIGGIIRYQNDSYMKQTELSNPWHVCTHWLAQSSHAETQSDALNNALDWSLRYASVNGILSEQVDPYNGEIRSVSPLVWSHAEFLTSLQKLQTLK